MNTNNTPDIQSTVSSNLSAVELVKAANPTLAGSIAETVADAQTDRFSDADCQLLKFHGVRSEVVPSGTGAARRVRRSDASRPRALPFRLAALRWRKANARCRA